MGELLLGLAGYFAFYNGERPHQSLENKTPDVVYRSAIGGGAMIVDKFGGAVEDSPVPLRSTGAVSYTHLSNPREDTRYGHIIRWRENDQTVTADEFTWDIFVQAGDTATTKPAKPTNDFKGNIVDTPDGSADFGAPDGLWFDWFGRLWVQTDQILSLIHI